MNKFNRAIYILILISTVCFPFAVAVFCSAPNFFGGWDVLWPGHNYEYYSIPNVMQQIFGGWVVFVAIFAFVIAAIKYAVKLNSRCVPWVVFGIALFLRVSVALSLGQITVPYSDFAVSWNRAVSGVLTTECNHVIYPAWICYSFFQRVFVLAFGNDFSLWLAFCATCDAVSALMVFLIGELIYGTKNKIIPIAAACLYIFYPQGISYVVTASPEHLSIAMFLVVIYLFIKNVLFQIGFTRLVLYAVLAGVLAGVGNAVKPIFPVFLIAMCIVVIGKSIQGSGKRLVLCAVVFIGVLSFVEHTTSLGITIASERMFNCQIKGNSPNPHYFCVGLNRQGEGQIHLGSLSRLWTKLITSGVKRDEASRITREAILTDWKDHYDEIPVLAAKKLVWAWQDDNVPFHYAILQLGQSVSSEMAGDNRLSNNNGQDGSKQGSRNQVAQNPIYSLDKISQYIQTGSYIWYFIVMVIAALSICRQLRDGQNEWTYALLCLLVLGYFGMTLLGEAQSRYKCLIMPYVFLLAAPFVAQRIMPLLGRRSVQN